jgi:hypothetical protein
MRAANTDVDDGPMACDAMGGILGGRCLIASMQTRGFKMPQLFTAHARKRIRPDEKKIPQTLFLKGSAGE